MRSTGPKTAEGKQRSRRNGLRHGFAAEVMVPEGDQHAYEAVLARWEREAGPDNVVEEHLIRRAAVGSVTLDRMDKAREEAREKSAREAVRHWERKKQAAARRKAQEIERDPGGVVADLEETAFGCEWLIRQWLMLDAPLKVGLSWDQRGVAKAQRLLGLPEGVPGIDAEPIVRRLWLFAGAVAPNRVTAIPRARSEAMFPTDPIIARSMLRRFIDEQVERLQTLRDESWEAVEGPERDAVISQAIAADVSRAGQLRHRYTASADRSCNAAIRLYLNLRDRRRRELLDIAKVATRCDTPRVPVGDGWWREIDSAPAPPGFARSVAIAPDDSVEPTSSTAGPIADPSPTPPAEGTDDRQPTRSPDEAPSAAISMPVSMPMDGPRAAVEPPALVEPRHAATTPAGRADRPGAPDRQTPGAPRRSEPISPAEAMGDPRRNPLIRQELRSGSPGRPAGEQARTEPLPKPDQPARPLADRAGRRDTIDLVP